MFYFHKTHFYFNWKLSIQSSRLMYQIPLDEIVYRKPFFKKIYYKEQHSIKHYRNVRIFNCVLTTLMVFLLHNCIQSNLYLILFYYLKFLIESWKIRQIVDITLDILYYTIVSATFPRTVRPPRKFVSLNNVYVFLGLFLRIVSRPKRF